MSNRNNNSTLRYPVVRNMPVARFYYQGGHVHPVRRTILVTESTPKYIKGYELREGNVTRPASSAPIKTFSRKKIAMNAQCGLRMRRRTAQKQMKQSTLSRCSLLDVLTHGI